MYNSFDIQAKTGGTVIGATDGYLLTRNDTNPPEGLNPSNGRKQDITSLDLKPLDQGFSISVPDRFTNTFTGNIYFKVTLYLEGTKMGTDERMTNEIAMSMFVFPSPKN